MINKKMPARAATHNEADTRNNLDNYTAKARLLSILYEGKKEQSGAIKTNAPK